LLKKKHFTIWFVLVNNSENKSSKYSTRNNKICGRCLDLNAGTRDDRHSMHKLTLNSLDVLHLTIRIAPFSRSFVDDRKGDRVRPILPILYVCTKRSPRKFVSIARIVNSCFTPISPLRSPRGETCRVDRLPVDRTW